MDRHGNAPRSANASVTAGLKCAPDTSPIVATMLMMMSPVAAERARGVTAPSLTRAMTAPPQSTTTSMHVPSTSVKSLRATTRGAWGAKASASGCCLPALSTASCPASTICTQYDFPCEIQAVSLAGELSVAAAVSRVG
jgi:hypothetical protein